MWIIIHFSFSSRSYLHDGDGCFSTNVRLDMYQNQRRRDDFAITVHDEDPKETEIEIQAFRNFLGKFDEEYTIEMKRDPIPDSVEAGLGFYLFSSSSFLGSGPEGADDLCFHTGEISPSFSSSVYPPLPSLKPRRPNSSPEVQMRPKF